MIKEDKRAATIREYYRRWTDARKDWETFAREDIDFYLGNHFSPEEADTLQERNQSSMPMDRLYSAIEQFKAIITSKPPKFSAVGREDSDNKMANVWKTLLEYIWDISDGDETFKQAVHDYAVTGLGYFYAYVDKEADYGRGEVKFTHVNPFRVAVDPNSRHRYFDDAAGISVSTILTKFQLLDLYPELSQPVEGKEKTLIELIETMDNDEDYPDSTNKYTAQSFTPDVVKDYVAGFTDFKEGEDVLGLMDTAPAKKIVNFLGYVDDIYFNVEDDSNPNLTPIGKEVFQVGKTMARFFPQIVEDYQIFKSGQVDKYLTEGTSTIEAIKKARDDIRENQGGVYYNQYGKYIAKKQLIGQGNILLPSENFDADLARLPNKMINPKYIEDKVIELSTSMAENVSKVSETSIAGPALKKVKNNLSKTEKELRKLKKEVEEVEKYRAPEFYKVSSEQIDNALETIKIAKSKREARIKNPFPNLNEAERQRVSELDQQNVNRSVEEMREAEALLQRLLNEQATSNIFPETSFLSSPNPNNPFGR